MDVQAYRVSSDLDLFSNFTYLWPTPPGRPVRTGGRTAHRRLRSDPSMAARTAIAGRIGADGLFDGIGDICTYRRCSRARVAVRQDEGGRSSVGVHVRARVPASTITCAAISVLRHVASISIDARSLPENSGKADSSTPSAKASLAWQPADALSLYASFGQASTPTTHAARRSASIRSAASLRSPSTHSRLEGEEPARACFLSDRWHATFAAWR